MEKGQLTVEYSTVQESYDRIVTSLQQEGVLQKVAIKMFQEKLLESSSLMKYKNSDSAFDFMTQILIRIELDKSVFDVFVKALSEIPCLLGLSKELASKNKAKRVDQASSHAVATSIEIARVVDKDVGFLVGLLCTHAYKWNDIGLALGFLSGEIGNISCIYPPSPQKHLTELLSQWAQWPTPAHPQDPTVEAMCAALRSNLVGLGATANELDSMKSSFPSQQGTGIGTSS